MSVYETEKARVEAIRKRDADRLGRMTVAALLDEAEVNAPLREVLERFAECLGLDAKND